MTPEQQLSAEARADAAAVAARVPSTQAPRASAFMHALINLLTKFGQLTEDLDYHLVRASMVLIFVFFGYQKWFAYEAQALIPYISNGPLIWWMYPVFGIRGASWFLGVSEWVFGALLFLGFWHKPLGILGALGACFSFIATVTIIPFMPDGWAASAGGFPAMTGQRAVPDEGCGAFGCLSLPTEAGCPARIMIGESNDLDTSSRAGWDVRPSDAEDGVRRALCIGEQVITASRASESGRGRRARCRS